LAGAFFSSTSAVTEGTGQNTVTTKTIAEAMDQPTNTVRRVLHDLTAYGLLARRGQGEGNADLWAPTARDKEEGEKERSAERAARPDFEFSPRGKAVE
jgi:DNA-binding IclR family transcriptional regulator